MEHAAIALWAVEKYGGPNHPLLGDLDQKAKLYQWMWFGPSTMYPALNSLFHSQDENTKNAAKEKLSKMMPLIESELGDKSYLLGEQFSLADAVIAYELWGMSFFDLLKPHPKVEAYLNRIFDRESWKATRSLECSP